jgi:hypothetical protein
MGTVRAAPLFGVDSMSLAKLVRTWIDSRGKSTSRQRSASSSPRRRPVNAAVKEDRGVLLGARGADEGHHLLGRDDIDVAAGALVYFSTEATGLVGRSETCWASGEHALHGYEQFVLPSGATPVSDARRASIAAGVTVSSC